MITYQPPNIPMIITIVGFGWAMLFAGLWAEAAFWIGIGGLVIWSVLEVISGVNWFRRLLGCAGIGLTVFLIIFRF